MSGKLLVTCAQMQVELPAHLDRLIAAGYEVVSPPIPGQQFTAAQLAPLMPDVVGLIAGDDQLDSSFFKASPDLQVIVRWGIGMDSVDHTAAAEHDVVVRNTPGVFGGEVADSALAYVLLLARAHHDIDRVVREGGWPKHEGVSLADSTLGIVGLGDIGRAVAARARGFGMELLGFDPYVDRTLLPAETTVVNDLGDLLQRSRFVVLTCPLTRETHHLMNAETLGHMRRDAFLINVARGPVIDESALEAALTEGRIAGAGLDVFEIEPLPIESPLRSLPGVVLGAHNGSNTREGVARASARAVDILLAELNLRP